MPRERLLSSSLCGISSRRDGITLAFFVGMAASSRAGTKRTPRANRRWSRRVMETSNALDLEAKLFTKSPRAIARSLKRSAERSTRRKSTPFRSAMSMLVFYQNRAGRNLSTRKKRNLDKAKDELRKLFGRTERGR